MTLGAGCSERHSVAPPGTGVVGVRPTEWKSEAERRDWSGKIHQVFPGWNDRKLKNLIKREFPFWFPRAPHYTPLEGFHRTIFLWLGPGARGRVLSTPSRLPKLLTAASPAVFF